MFYRAFVVGIVLFWMWMTALLVRLEFAPGETRTLPVPTSHVWKLLFEHEESSALNLFNGRQRLGEVNVQPRKLPPGGESSQQLTWTGSFVLNLPGVSGERVVLRGTLELNDREEVQHLEVVVNFREPDPSLPGTTVVFDGQPRRDQWHYLIRSGYVVVKERSGTVENLLDDPGLRAFGLDPKTFGQLGRQQAAGSTISARHGTLHLNGEDLETYIVTMRQDDGGPESSIYVNPLGRILAVKTFIGYDLYDSSFIP